MFAVEDTAVQITGRSLPSGPVQVAIDGRQRLDFVTQGEPWATTIEHLAPQTTYRIAVTAGDSRQVLGATTLPSPPGERLCRIGTLNDVHIGSLSFGIGHFMRERPRPQEVSGTRCARAAFAEVADWPIDHLVLKGDVVHLGAAKEWATLQQLLDDCPVDVDYVLGNHETRAATAAGRPLGPDDLVVDPVDALGPRGFDFSEPVRVRDLPGVRLILIDTAVPHSDRGHVRDLVAAVADAASEASTPVLVFGHHNFQPRRLAYMLPSGISGTEANPFLDALERANPAALVASGHTHRHRRRMHNGVPVVEVGSPKDYPGVWAGYEVTEGGVRQVVRRVEQPDCIRWTERTRRGAFGMWGRWGPGHLDDRCFTHPWPHSGKDGV